MANSSAPDSVELARPLLLPYHLATLPRWLAHRGALPGHCTWLARHVVGAPPRSWLTLAESSESESPPEPRCWRCALAPILAGHGVRLRPLPVSATPPVCHGPHPAPVEARVVATTTGATLDEPSAEARCLPCLVLEIHAAGAAGLALRALRPADVLASRARWRAGIQERRLHRQGASPADRQRLQGTSDWGSADPGEGA